MLIHASNYRSKFGGDTKWGLAQVSKPPSTSPTERWHIISIASLVLHVWTFLYHEGLEKRKKTSFLIPQNYTGI